MTIPEQRRYVAPVTSSTRYDTLGQIECMVLRDGYVMVRRPFAHPFVMTAENFALLAMTEAEALEAGLQVHWGVPEPSFTRPAYEPIPAGANARPH